MKSATTTKQNVQLAAINDFINNNKNKTNAELPTGVTWSIDDKNTTEFNVTTKALNTIIKKYVVSFIASV